MIENFPIFAKDINLQIQIAEKTANKIKQKKPTPKHKIVKLLKTKGKKSFNTTRKKKQHLIYRRKTIQMTVHFSSENLGCRQKWNNIFQVLKENNFQPNLKSYAQQNYLSKFKQDILQIQAGFLKFILKGEETKIATIILKKQNKVGGISLPNFKTYSIATVIKTVQYW